ncbi:DEAD-box ATP-dependent RNA helicase 10 [Vitis vinifera]|uniref:DEAD-box ATP-dependent RNA helicase 10 n=1 Tax=Vitis vinifera TaxID=29760 RepID=A0A438GT57_VITVI|nr:DEAD-box ATP-dependent RNA helicase 10 [Vitis vinifera]
MGFMKREEKVRVWERRGDEEDEAYLNQKAHASVSVASTTFIGVPDKRLRPKGVHLLGSPPFYQCLWAFSGCHAPESHASILHFKTLLLHINGVQDYIHRVGRTARAGRSGVAISLVNQYELEWYIQIEKLIGKKLPEFPAQEEEVLLLLERVTEAKRISQMVVLFSNFLFFYYLRLAS